jgi:hypothetical protein
MNRIAVFPLLMALLAGSAAWGQHQAYRLDRQAQWEEWTFPPGLLQFDPDGAFTLVAFPDTVNAALDAPEYTHSGAGNKEIQGGVWRAGSTARAAGIAAGNIIDGDYQTLWKPDPDAPLEDWWIEVDLGRVVPLTKIRLVFPDEEGARPLRDFRVFGTRGYREAISQDLFAYSVLGGTTRYNDQTVVEYELSPWRELTTRILYTGLESATDVAPSPFQPVQYIRIRADSKSEDAALAEVEAHTFGENVALQAIRRGGQVEEQSGRGVVLIDGDQNTSWAQSVTGGRDVIWMLDLGARYWVKNILMLGAEKRGYAVGDMVEDHLLLGSAEESKLEVGDIDFAVIHEFLTPLGGGRYDLQYFLPTPRAFRYLAGVYKNRNGDMSEIMVIPTGHVAGVALESGFIDLGEFTGERRSKQILGIHWEADQPEGTRVLVRSRTGHRLTEKIDYYKKDGTLLPDKAAYESTNKFLRGETDTSIVAGPDWSAWSTEYLEPGIFLSPSPRRLLQLQLLLTSDRPEAAPTVRHLEVRFTDALIRGIEGRIAPQSATPGVPTTFTYELWGDFTEGGGFDQLLFATPSRIDPDSLQVWVGGVALPAVEWEQAAADSLLIQLPQVVEQAADTVRVQLRVQIEQNPTLFRTFVARTEVPDLWQEVLPTNSVPRATQVFFPAVPKPGHLLANLSVAPRIATPNGDGIGDQVQIRFLVLNVEVEPEVWIYSLDGRRVRRLDGGRAAAGYSYTWSGRDEANRLSPPGLYVCHIRLKTQLGEQQISRTIGLAY